jgi:hypothetical protein
MNAVINAPGSWHNAHVARPIFDVLQRKVPDGFYLVSDTAFPCGSQSIAGKIRAPLKSGERVPADPAARQHLLAVDWQLLLYRQTAEWGMRML